MDAGKKAGMTVRIERMRKLLDLALEQADAENAKGVEVFAELLSEQADSLAAEAKAAK